MHGPVRVIFTNIPRGELLADELLLSERPKPLRIGLPESESAPREVPSRARYVRDQDF